MSELDIQQGCLYVVWNRCHDGCWDYDYPDAPTKPDHQCYNLLPYPVTKVTARRIYFHDAGRPHRRYFISRDAFEVDEDGDTTAWHRGLCERLYLNRPTWHIRPQPKTIADLRREMADAHPDRGGDRDRFATARRRYLVARGAGPRS